MKNVQGRFFVKDDAIIREEWFALTHAVLTYVDANLDTDVVRTAVRNRGQDASKRPMQVWMTIDYHCLQRICIHKILLINCIAL
ncbi:hypothetical protein NECAME_05314, partial [Necator americanus]